MNFYTTPAQLADALDALPASSQEKAVLVGVGTKSISVPCALSEKDMTDDQRSKWRDAHVDEHAYPVAVVFDLEPSAPAITVATLSAQLRAVSAQELGVAVGLYKAAPAAVYDLPGHVLLVATTRAAV